MCECKDLFSVDHLLDVRDRTTRFVGIVFDNSNQLLAINRIILIDVVEVHLHAIANGTKRGQLTRHREGLTNADLIAVNTLKGIPIVGAIVELERGASADLNCTHERELVAADSRGRTR